MKIRKHLEPECICVCMVLSYEGWKQCTEMMEFYKTQFYWMHKNSLALFTLKSCFTTQFRPFYCQRCRRCDNTKTARDWAWESPNGWRIKWKENPYCLSVSPCLFLFGLRSHFKCLPRGDMLWNHCFIWESGVGWLK